MKVTVKNKKPLVSWDAIPAGGCFQFERGDVVYMKFRDTAVQRQQSKDSVCLEHGTLFNMYVSGHHYVLLDAEVVCTTKDMSK